MPRVVSFWFSAECGRAYATVLRPSSISRLSSSSVRNLLWLHGAS